MFLSCPSPLLNVLLKCSTSRRNFMRTISSSSITWTIITMWCHKMLRIMFSPLSSIRSPTFRRHRRPSHTTWSSRFSNTAWSKTADKSTKMAFECRRASLWMIIKWARRQPPTKTLKSSATRSPRAPFPTWVSLMTNFSHFPPDKINKSPLRRAIFPNHPQHFRF